MPSVILANANGVQVAANSLGDLEYYDDRGFKPTVGSYRAARALLSGQDEDAPLPTPAEYLPDLITKRVVQLGVYIAPGATADDASFVAAAGEQPTLALTFPSYANSLDVATVTAQHQAGRTPILGWMPQDGTNNATQPLYQLADIISGAHDAYMTTYLTAVRDLGFPVYIRWAHEMNGNWYPWSEQTNGNTTGQYAQAFRHVVDLARSVGATNVKWVWAVNTEYPGSTPLPGLYPGDDYVDVVAVHGYNWGATGPDGVRFPAVLFDATIRDLDAIAPDKPLWITEVGCAPDDGFSKATWFTDFFDWLLESRVGAVVYFHTFKSDTPGEKDWRVNVPTGAGAAFSTGMVKLRAQTRPDGVDVRRHLAGPHDIADLSDRLDLAPGDPSSLWAAGSAETLSRFSLIEIPGVSGRLTLSYFTAPRTISINTLAIALGGTGAAGATLARAGIFEVNDDGSVKLVARTANDPTFAAATYTDRQRALATAGGYPAQVTLLRGRRYAFGWLTVATTPGNLKGVQLDLPTLPPVVNRFAAGQTDIASTYSNAQLVNHYQPLFIAGLRY